MDAILGGPCYSPPDFNTSYGVMPSSICDEKIKIAAEPFSSRYRRYRFTNRVINYRLDDGFSASEAQTIRDTMDYIESKTCIRFLNTPPKNSSYLDIIKTKHVCSGHVGKQRTGSLRLTSKCIKHKTIIYELMGLLGFYREETRQDRDSYVKINCGNICPWDYYFFAKVYWDYIPNYGTPYDYCSIMHSGEFSYSYGNGSTYPSITPLKKTDCVIGQGETLSEFDIMRINIAYHCIY